MLQTSVHVPLSRGYAAKLYAILVAPPTIIQYGAYLYDLIVALENLNADKTKEFIFRARHGVRYPSPQQRVTRMPIDRLGVEVARATSLVRCDSNASFPEHTHGAEGEYYVFTGIFHDVSRAAAKSMNVRNPNGSNHQPWTNADGAIMCVKLRWMTATSQERSLRVMVLAEGPEGDVIIVEGHGIFKDGDTAAACTSEPLVERDFVRIPAGKVETLQWETRLGCRLLVKQGLF